MTRIVNVYKAQSTGFGAYATVDALGIHVDIEQPDQLPDDYAQTDANLITNALYASLPGATIDALLAAMLIRRGTQLRVRLQPGSAEASDATT